MNIQLKSRWIWI